MSKEKSSQSCYLISIDEIENGQIDIFDFEDEIAELEGCRLKAKLKFKPLGDFIQVLGTAKGKITLECDRCLNKFQYNLDFKIDEMYAKNSLMNEYGQELELSGGQFVTDLEGAEEIDIYDLLYQSVILALPNKKVCGINCNEGLFVSDEEMKIHDTRMDVFKNIPIKGKNN